MFSVRWERRQEVLVDDFPQRNAEELTLNSAKSALISLLDGCDDELVDVDDIDDDSSSSITRQMSSSLVALDVLVVGGSTGRERKAAKIND